METVKMVKNIQAIFKGNLWVIFEYVDQEINQNM